MQENTDGNRKRDADRAGQPTTIRESDIQGMKYLRVLRPLMKQLRDVGSGRDHAGNRKLFMDQYCILILLWLYSPIVDSLRGLQQLSQLPKVRKRFHLPRTSLGSLSESVTIFDPERLKRIATELAEQLPEPSVPKNLKQLRHTLVAVDGSVVKVLQRISQLAWTNNRKGEANFHGYRLHTHFEILRGLPKRVETTSANPKCEAAEQAVLARTIQPDHCYVIDRGYQKFGLWNQINASQSSYVCRVRDRLKYEVREEKPLDRSAQDAGVLSDEIVTMGTTTRTDHTVRLICVRCSPHTSRGRQKGRSYSSTGPSSDGVLRIATNLQDVPAELISQLYQMRWTIELFFRMFKQLLGCRHLLSTKQNGVEIQVYCALIACMLIQLYTGGQPTKRTFELMCFYLVGWAEVEDLREHIGQLKVLPDKPPDP